MKLARKKPAATVGRQRATPDRNSAPAYNYLASRSERTDDPSRRSGGQAKARSRLLSTRFWLRRGGLLLVVAVGVICLISIMSVSTSPRIVIADEQSSTMLRSGDIYEQAASQQLSSSVFNRNKLTFDSAGVARDLERRFPELTNVTVSLPLVGHRPIYYVESAQPAFILNAVNGSFIIDERGRALPTASSSSDNALDLITISDQSGVRIERGQQVISASDVSFIRTVIQTFAAKEVTVASMVLPGQNAQELDVRVAGQAYIIKFDMHQDGGAVRQQAGSYLATAQQLRAQNITPAEYIDVRVPGRVYYK